MEHLAQYNRAAKDQLLGWLFTIVAQQFVMGMGALKVARTCDVDPTLTDEASRASLCSKPEKNRKKRCKNDLHLLLMNGELDDLIAVMDSQSEAILADPILPCNLNVRPNYTASYVCENTWLETLADCPLKLTDVRLAILQLLHHHFRKLRRSAILNWGAYCICRRETAM